MVGTSIFLDPGIAIDIMGFHCDRMGYSMILQLLGQFRDYV